MEKDIILKNILIVIFAVIMAITLLTKEKLSKNVFKEEIDLLSIIDKIKRENDDLIINKNYNDFIYLEFKNNNNYFIDTKTGELKNLEDYTAYLDKFKEKINELLDLKYPKFITDELKNNQNKKYYLKEELVINYDTDILPNEKVTLKVNYKEIKEFFKFNFKETDFLNEDGYNYQTNKKTIAFTFDDGPSGKYTNDIVSILKENKAHATFFMVGNKMEDGIKEIKNVLDNGNEIGSHSYNHKNMVRMNLKDIIAGEEKTKEIYKRITNKDLIYMRPPYGNINNKIKKSLDTIFITWNIDTEDWLHKDKDYIVKHILENVRDGDIVLMHDCYETTVEAVKVVLPLLYKQGYQVVSVSELAKIKNYELKPHDLYRYLKKV